MMGPPNQPPGSERPSPSARRGAGPEAGSSAGPDAGTGVDARARAPEQSLASAFDVKAAQRAFREQFGDDELRQIPIVPEGQRLQEGATYVDLADPERREFRATAAMSAEAARWYVPKDRVPHPIWNRLTGVREADLLDEGADGGD